MKIHQKIAAILAKAKSTDSMEEASTFLAKAQELMDQNGLDIYEIERVVEDDPLAIEKDAITVPSGWQTSLLNALAHFFHCQIVIHQRGSTRKISLAGRESSRETVKVMWPYIIKCVGKQASDMRRTGESLASYQVARREVSDALTHILWRKISQRDEKAKNQHPAKALIEEQYKSLKLAKARRLKTSIEALSRAEGINFDQQIQSDRRALT